MSTISFIYFSILICTLLYNNIDAYYKDCSQTRKCEQNTINCIDNEDCLIDCSGRYGCSYSIINCPSHANCNIKCSNQFSCTGITINASPNTTLNVTCDGSNEACKNSIINGNINTEMNIKCSDTYACYNSTIDARYASKLHMIDCATDFWTCYMLTIYCPPNINGRKRCILEGDNSFGGEYNANKQEPINFYAINSWNDIEFKTIKTDDYYGKMHCMENYSQSCDIAQCCDWKCTNMRSICQNPPTVAPTVSIIPTQYPSKTPTFYITNNPTSFPAVITSLNVSIIVESTQDSSFHSAENVPQTTGYNKHAVNDDIDKSETSFSKHYKYMFYIMIGSCMICCVICFEFWYCYYKRHKKKSKFKHIAIEQNNSDETQMICKEGNDISINNTTSEHYKQTISHSELIKNFNTDEYVMKQLSDDMEILGDDEYDENAIVTKMPTFENAENDEEVMDENYTTNEYTTIQTKRDTMSMTIMSEGDKNKKHTISFIGDAICTPRSEDIDESELNIGSVVTISPKHFSPHSTSKTKRNFS